MRRYIENKICKNFVDFCLLEDIEQVKGFVRIDQFKTLNPFEMVLLVQTIVNHKELAKEAEMIVEMLEMEQKGIKKNYQDFKHSFDTIINAKASEDGRPRGGARTKQTARMSSPGAA